MTALLIQCLIFLYIRHATGGTVWPLEVVQNVIRGVVTQYSANCVYLVQSAHSQGECSCSKLLSLVTISVASDGRSSDIS
jgi:hypothetical protein